ncbi:MAG: M23 family metallopeptidase [Arachnia sp.]
MRRILLAVAALLVLPLVGVPPAHAEDGLILEPPVAGSVVTGFSPGSTRYSAGHRGVDLAAGLGDPIRAAASGTVWFAGSVGGRDSVSIDHGNGLRTTYTPVKASVAAGDSVKAGEVIGTLSTWPGHCAGECLHWGLTDGTDYFDPTDYLKTAPIRLLPEGTTPAPVVWLPSVASGPGSLPVAGRLTSPYGMRRHPVTGVMKLHDGTDLAAPCGTPVRATWAGTVTSAGYDGAYGYRVIVADAAGRSGYAHLASMSVRAGDTIQAGTVLGTVGSTGMSTGCHLHWMVWRGGSTVDPMGLVDT